MSLIKKQNQLTRKLADEVECELEKKCSECGNLFACENDVTCWCSTFPNLPKKELDDNDCMCKGCLLKKYRKNLMKVDEIKKDLIEEEHKYQWKNRH